MKGPTLSFSSSVLSGPDTEPTTAPEEMIAGFTREILSAIPLDEFEWREEYDSWDTIRRAAEIVSLYLARSWRFKSPWWADQAIQKLFTERLPFTKVTENMHSLVANLRLADEGQKKSDFLRQIWEDQSFFQVAAMRAAKIRSDDASQHAARWRDEVSNGEFTVKASVVEKGYPKWASDPFRGKVWRRQLSQMMDGLTEAAKIDLIRSNKLRAEMLPAPPNGLKGERR